MQTTYLTIIGQTHGDPMSSVTEILNDLPGVGDVKVSASGGDVTINFNSGRRGNIRFSTPNNRSMFKVRSCASSTMRVS